MEVNMISQNTSAKIVVKIRVSEWNLRNIVGAYVRLLKKF